MDEGDQKVQSSSTREISNRDVMCPWWLSLRHPYGIYESSWKQTLRILTSKKTKLFLLLKKSFQCLNLGIFLKLTFILIEITSIKKKLQHQSMGLKLHYLSITYYWRYMPYLKVKMLVFLVSILKMLKLDEAAHATKSSINFFKD